MKELKKDAIKRRADILGNILAEFEEFGVDCKYTIAEDYEIVNFRVVIGSLFFDFHINLVKDEIVLRAYTNKLLTNNSDVGRYHLTMTNIDELLMSIKSFENVYFPFLDIKMD